VWRGFVSLGDADTRRAFLDTARSVLDVRGQRVNATNQALLGRGSAHAPGLGRARPLIPVRHAHAAHERIPGSRLDVFPGAGHFPHRDDPRRFVHLLQDFVATTQPARFDEARLRERMREIEVRPAASADRGMRRRRRARASTESRPGLPPR